jgi:hypothetical protein
MARKKSYRKNAAPTDADIDAALRVLRADYYSDVRGVAENVLERMIEEGEGADVHDIMHESVDGTQRVIYTYQARVGLICTDNADAYVEEYGDVPVEGDSIKWEAMMYAALAADAHQLLGATDFDSDDPETWEPALKELKDNR